jgi:cobaltochelatase CobN
MHLLVRETHTLDEAAPAVDLGHAPADICFLSFSDSDLGAAAAAWEASLPTLRLASLAALRHPMSVDLYVARTIAQARAVVVRLLGGLDYWRYGVEECFAVCRARGIALALLAGDARQDPGLADFSTVPPAALARLDAYLRHGGPDNLRAALRYAAHLGGIGPDRHTPPQPLPGSGEWRLPGSGEWRLPGSGEWRLPGSGEWRLPAAATPHAVTPAAPFAPAPAAPLAVILFYRSQLLAGDTAPVTSLAAALAARGLTARALFVDSLKQPETAAFVTGRLHAWRPAVVLNATGFSATIEAAGAPVLQLVLAGSDRAGWEASARGLSPADLAMQVVLPELDGRLLTTAISFKAEAAPLAGLDFAPRRHVPDPDGIALAAGRAAGWARLAATPAEQRRVAIVLSDYPGGQTGHAVGLDSFASLHAILTDLAAAGYDIGPVPTPAELTAALTGPARDRVEHDFAALPPPLQAQMLAAWGPPPASVKLRAVRLRRVLVAVQPDRGSRSDRKSGYHDEDLPPCHAYAAFYLHLRDCHALVHLGTHGTLEWLPGKAVALGAACWPAVLTGGLPVIYPFIVSNPGEAAVAKRRLGAVTIGHLTPPLRAAGLYGAAAELERLMDEYAAAAGMDRRRAALLRADILRIADSAGLRPAPALTGRQPDPALTGRQPDPTMTGRRPNTTMTGLRPETTMTGLRPVTTMTGLRPDAADADPRSRQALAAAPPGASLRPDPAEDPLARLDAMLCDLKEMQIEDGLHVFGRPADSLRRAGLLAALAAADPLADPVPLAARLDASAAAERDALLAALDGRAIAPGPAGAPSRGRADVLPTGRNLTSADPRLLPTPAAMTLAARAATALLDRYRQDHGDWPRRLVIDLWGSATLRTGGESLALALVLLGVQPVWDAGTGRLSGFEVTPLALLDRPRVDVTLRISGLFRDAFEAQMTLFDSAVQALAARAEPAGWNPLAGIAAPVRIFGPAPGAYGAGDAARLAGGDAAELAAAYLAASATGYGSGAAARPGFTGPAAEPHLAAPSAEPHLAAPSAEPHLAAPSAEPHLAAPSAEPHLAAPSAEPHLAAPSAEPHLAAPSAEPHLAAPSAEPHLAAPSAEPHLAAPSAEPHLAAPSAEPHLAAPSAEPRPAAPTAEPRPAAPTKLPHRAGTPARPDFAAAVAAADALVHPQDHAESDLLDSLDHALHAGGFAAAAASLGAAPALYQLDTTRAVRVRSLREAITRSVRGRAANPAWIAGQMAHGHSGAAAIARTAGALHAFAILTRERLDPDYEALFAATLAVAGVERFLAAENPQAHAAMRAAFRDALARGLWRPRRNDAARLLDAAEAATHVSDPAEAAAPLPNAAEAAAPLAGAAEDAARLPDPAKDAAG